MNAPAKIKVVSLYRYPVKGLSPQRLDRAALEPGRTISWDRAFAIENGPGRFDPEQPKYLPKINFLMLMRNERLAALTTHFDEDTQTLIISRDGKQVAQGALNTKLGRQLIEQFMASYMSGELRGRPRIVSAPGHSFSDVAAKCLHLVNLATIRDFERATGRAIDPLRFRANVYFDGADPWAEKKWEKRTIALGGARLKVFAETTRCEATNVDPATGARNMMIPPTLQRTIGDMCLGVYAEVVGGGEIRPGDPMSIED
jgi:hypothetical protein